MNKKFNKREVRILKLMAALVILTAGLELYEWFAAQKEQLKFDIETEMSAQETFLQKLKANPDEFQKKSNELALVMTDAEERILKMDKESNAQFRFQEDITIVADKTGINLNSLNKRRSKELFKGSEMIQLKAYFGFNCPLVNLLEFLDQISQKEYFVAVDTLNVNVNTRRRRSRKKSKEPENQETTIRGSCVLATLYQKSSEDIANPVPQPDDPEEDEELEDQEDSNLSTSSTKQSEPKKAPEKRPGEDTGSPKDTKATPKDKTPPKLIGPKTPKEKTELVGKPRPLTHTNKKKARGF